MSLALRALGVGTGDEVLVPANTSVATWHAVHAIGAIPVGVEPVESTHTIDPARLADAVTSRTRAVVPVHLYGRPAEMAPIVSFANAHALAVVADAAQAHGAAYHGDGLGSLATPSRGASARRRTSGTLPTPAPSRPPTPMSRARSGVLATSASSAHPSPPNAG